MPPKDNGYERFLSRVQPFALDLTSCSVSIDRALYWKLRDKKREPLRELAVEYKMDHISKNLFDVRGELRVTISDPETKQRALRVECIFDGHFHAEQPIKKEYAERFAASEFRVVVWPYFRQFISDTTARMGIPPIFIPISIRRRASEKH